MDEQEIKKLNNLEQEARRISAFLKTPYDATQLQERLTRLTAFNARTGEMLAEAEYILARQKGQVLDRLLLENPKMSANQQKTAVEAECAYAIMVVRLIERTNRATVHGSENGITQAYCEK